MENTNFEIDKSANRVFIDKLDFDRTRRIYFALEKLSETAVVHLKAGQLKEFSFAADKMRPLLCYIADNNVKLSQHIGDLKNLETLEFYSESAERFKHLFRVKPELAVYDMHPDYLSTKYAKSLNIPGVAVQHHHAHIASCMAEHQLDEKVIGIALDGVGYGDDGKIWGGEFFVCDLADYDRVTYFDYAKMPGGDKATKHPWRMALSYLHKVYGKSVRDYLELDFLKDVPEFEINLILDMLEKNINTPLTSSTGRLFDAMSALLNICTKASFHAEAPMRLEAECLADLDDHFEYDIQESICLDAMFEEVVMSLNKGIDRRILATKFHNTIINIICTCY